VESSKNLGGPVVNMAKNQLKKTAKHGQKWPKIVQNGQKLSKWPKAD